MKCVENCSIPCYVMALDALEPCAFHHGGLAKVGPGVRTRATFGHTKLANKHREKGKLYNEVKLFSLLACILKSCS